jgi:hypothetical protein
MDAIGKSILGLTIQCAQCHNHKFDPLTQEEYYRMFAYLNNDHEASMVAYTPEENLKRADLLRQMRDLEEGLRHKTSDWQERMAAWEDSVRNDQPEWVTLACQHTSGDNGERFYYYSDNSIRASGYAPTQWTATFTTTNNLPSIGAFRLEQLTDAELPCNGPGRSIKGMSALSKFEVEAADAKNPPTNMMSNSSRPPLTIPIPASRLKLSSTIKRLRNAFMARSNTRSAPMPMPLGESTPARADAINLAKPFLIQTNPLSSPTVLS